MEQFWKLETSEALANSLPQFSVDDKKAVDMWEQSIELVNGHYQMDIPFKSKNPNLPDNRTVLKNFYADDCLKAVGTTEGAINIVRSLCQLLALGGFRLTKWVSNDRKVLEAVPVGERAKGSRTLILTVVLSLLRERWGFTGTLRSISLVSRLRESTGSLPGEDS